MAESTASFAPAASTARATALAPAMREICGDGNVLTDPLELRTYECDGLTSHRATPALVVLPSTAGQVAAVVRACAGAGVVFVARGSGTGLSGGAVPNAEGVLIVMST
jgi:glycolate oxidase